MIACRGYCMTRQKTTSAAQMGVGRRIVAFSFFAVATLSAIVWVQGLGWLAYSAAASVGAHTAKLTTFTADSDGGVIVFWLVRTWPVSDRRYTFAEAAGNEFFVTDEPSTGEMPRAALFVPAAYRRRRNTVDQQGSRKIALLEVADGVTVPAWYFVVTFLTAGFGTLSFWADGMRPRFRLPSWPLRSFGIGTPFLGSVMVGSVERVGGTLIETQFLVFGLPVFPLRSYYVTECNAPLEARREIAMRAIPIRINRRSVVAGYLRAYSWVPAAAFIACASAAGPGHDVPRIVVEGLAVFGTCLCAAKFGLGGLSTAERQRRAHLLQATGFSIEKESLLVGRETPDCGFPVTARAGKGNRSA